MNIPINNLSELFIFGFNGESLPNEVKTFLSNNFVGGVILFKNNISSLEQVVKLNETIIALNDHPPLISVDQEGGRVSRLRGICTDIPPMKELTNSLLKDPKKTFRLGAMQGRELLALGFNVNFSPVCDVLSINSEVIGDRSFSSDPEVVAKLSSQLILGLQASGIASCAKHFPGHGFTSVDSHLDLPKTEISLKLLENRDLLPFKSAIECGVASIMTAHIIVENLDSYPATMSQKINQEILRKKLNFNGVLISDDLDMKAVADNYSLEEILEKSLLSSVDMFIIGNNFNKFLEAIKVLHSLVNKSEILKEKVLLSLERIKVMKKRYIGKAEKPSIEYAKSIVRSKPHLDLISSLRGEAEAI